MLPCLISYKENCQLTLQRINGQPYMDNLATFDPARLASTIASFHLATLKDETCLCQVDNQPANILQDGQRYYMVDFGDSIRDFPELDVTHLMLFWAADFPRSLFTDSCRCFLDAYIQYFTIKDTRWQYYLKHNIIAFDERRNKYKKPGGMNPPDIQQSNRQYLHDYSFTKKNR